MFVFRQILIVFIIMFVFRIILDTVAEQFQPIMAIDKQFLLKQSCNVCSWFDQKSIQLETHLLTTTRKVCVNALKSLCFV